MNLKNHKKSLPERDVKLDGLRVIGLLAIILAHVNPPEILFQLRNFDVPLMVLISGAVYGISSGTQKQYFPYIFGRISRLLVPTWIFLSIFFTYYFFITVLRGNYFPYSRETIITSYELLTGIGYVWIIRIFILVAIVLPLLIKLYRGMQNKGKYLSIIFLIYILYEVIYLFYSKTPFIKSVSFFDFIFQNFIFYILPFGCVAGLGLYLIKANNRSIFFLLTGFVLLFLYLTRVYNLDWFINTQRYKYPPRIYYLSYALSVSLFLYLFSKTIILKKIFATKPIIFISSFSLWIYLWHIFFLFQWNILRKYISSSFQNYIIEYIFIISFAILLTYLQSIIIKKLAQRFNKHTNIKTILTKYFLK